MTTDNLISVIVPSFNEAQYIEATLQSLQSLRRRGNQVILVDGGSSDATVKLCRPLVDQVIHCSKGRARQMNAGAVQAFGHIFWFLHADTMIPEGADDLISQALADGGKVWGRFDVRLSGQHGGFRVIETLMNLRSRISGIATGDQGIFVEHNVFKSIGGFPEQPLMEDIELSRRLKKIGRPVCLTGKLLTSSRRWRQQGVLATIVLMWRLRLAYFLGADAGYLARRYQEGRRDGPGGEP